MTYKEAWCKIVSEINNTYDDEVKEAMFMLAVAAEKQDNMIEVMSHLPEKLNEIKNMPISIYDKDIWNANALKQFEEENLK